MYRELNTGVFTEENKDKTDVTVSRLPTALRRVTIVAV